MSKVIIYSFLCIFAMRNFTNDYDFTFNNLLYKDRQRVESTQNSSNYISEFRGDLSAIYKMRNSTNTIKQIIAAQSIITEAPEYENRHQLTSKENFLSRFLRIIPIHCNYKYVFAQVSLEYYDKHNKFLYSSYQDFLKENIESPFLDKMEQEVFAERLFKLTRDE